MDDLAELYNNEVTIILYRQLPTRTVKRQPWPSDPWFDAECRAAKRSTRRSERAAAAKSQDQDGFGCGHGGMAHTASIISKPQRSEA